MKKGFRGGFAYFIILSVYVLASALGILVAKLLDLDLWLEVLIADAAATVFVFAFSLAFRNASVYDPYWSVQPMVILTAYAAARGSAGIMGIIATVCVFLWGIRLTANWAYVFRGMDYEDWRYVMLREKTGKLYPMVNFFGIHMFPTLVVYLCTLPAVYLVASGAPFRPLGLIGAAVCLTAVALETVSDVQMQRFRARGTGGVISEGLWKYSRHPNYLGEILMWWGIALIAVFSLPFEPIFVIGAAVNTVMFLVISIPMAEKRYSTREGYAENRKRTRVLLPLRKPLFGGK